jgi:hypothetical protein
MMAATGMNDSPPALDAASFTPILGTLLLSPTTAVATPARMAVVDLLARIRQADEASIDTDATPVGTFLAPQRRLMRAELLHQVVIGMGRLDVPPAGVESADVSPMAISVTQPSSPTMTRTDAVQQTPPSPVADVPAAVARNTPPERVALPPSAPPTPRVGGGERPFLGTMSIALPPPLEPWQIALPQTPGGGYEYEGVSVHSPPPTGVLPGTPRIEITDPWAVALPATPAGERNAYVRDSGRAAAHSPLEPWAIALPETPLGEYPYGDGPKSPVITTVVRGVNNNNNTSNNNNPYFPPMPVVTTTLLTGISPPNVGGRSPSSSAPELASPHASEQSTPETSPATRFPPTPPDVATPTLADASVVVVPGHSPGWGPMAHEEIRAVALVDVPREEEVVAVEEEPRRQEWLGEEEGAGEQGELGGEGDIDQAALEASAQEASAQAAVGRLSSMSLIAAVTANGM